MSRNSRLTPPKIDISSCVTFTPLHFYLAQTFSFWHISNFVKFKKKNQKLNWRKFAHCLITWRNIRNVVVYCILFNMLLAVRANFGFVSFICSFLWTLRSIFLHPFQCFYQCLFDIIQLSPSLFFCLFKGSVCLSFPLPLQWSGLWCGEIIQYTHTSFYI